MTDTPGWASPGSAPSPDGREPGASGPDGSTDRPGPAEPPAQPGAHPQGPGPKWSSEQPPAGQWSAPTGPPSPGQAPPPPPPGPGWGGAQPGGPGGYGGGAHGGPPGGHSGYGTPGGPGAWGGWNGGWGGPPPAAKPGVIPLRPLGVGEILDGAVSTMRTYWRTVLGISLTVAVLTQLGVLLLQGFVLKNSETTATLNNPDASPDEMLRVVGSLAVGSGAVLVISVVAGIIATALLTTVTSRAVLGKPVSAGEAWRDARHQVPKLFGLLFLLGLISFGVMLAGALPGIVCAIAGGGKGATVALFALGLLAALVVLVWLTVRFSLSSPALMLERQGIVKSIGRSAKLVRGSWWRVLGIQLLAAIIANIVSSLVVIPFTLIAGAAGGEGMVGIFSTATSETPSWTFLILSAIGSVIGSMLTLPINAGVTVLLYIDQRIRREALDLELARAAGVQGPTASTPGPVPGS
ncbi:proline-rich domain-containing protein [Streptomyces collinus]|uniref:proline-rich domain-containing protein n=1 Tax=Streptomyces collinus TaxID=42684 RepID=UPI003329CF64